MNNWKKLALDPDEQCIDECNDIANDCVVACDGVGDCEDECINDEQLCNDGCVAAYASAQPAADNLGGCSCGGKAGSCSCTTGKRPGSYEQFRNRLVKMGLVSPR